MKNLLLLPLLALSITLTSCSDDDSTDDTVVVVEEEGTILTFEDVALKLSDSDSDTFDAAFSASTGETFSVSEVDQSNIAVVDIVSFANQAFIAFVSPDEDSDISQVAGAKTTKIQMDQDVISVDQFDAMEDDTLLKDLSIESDNESQSINYRGVILFETAEGKKGAIKVNALNAERILFDVKVME